MCCDRSVGVSFQGLLPNPIGFALLHDAGRRWWVFLSGVTEFTVSANNRCIGSSCSSVGTTILGLEP